MRTNGQLGRKYIGDSVLHIELRKWADIMVIAPLSANTLAKVTYSVPFALASIYSKDSGTGQGLALGLLNLAIVIPQMGVTLISGPLDSIFGGSNLPAFVWGGIAAVIGGIAALKLPNPDWEMPRTVSRVQVP